MKLLIIDDGADGQIIAEALLTWDGIECVCAGSAQEAILLARSLSPDLILLDADQPQFSNPDFRRLLKAEPTIRTTPVILLSGQGSIQDQGKWLDDGAVDVVTKPVNARDLWARVQTAMRVKKLQELLAEYARIDPLTSLANEQFLVARLKEEWERLRRHGGRLSLIVLAIDHLKETIELYGASVGDRIFREVASVLRQQCRHIDLPTRYGGEEFAILAPGEGARNAAKLAERCCHGIRQITLPVAQGQVQLTASAGVADAACVLTDEALVAAAEQYMYEARWAGGDCVRFRHAE